MHILPLCQKNDEVEENLKRREYQDCFVQVVGDCVGGNWNHISN